MPIYEYRCTECGFQKEYLQKVSDPALTQCPQCGNETFSKMVTAAGFQLKGTGWYVTDFRNNTTTTSPKKSDDKSGDAKSGSDAAAGGETKSESKSDTKTDSAGSTTPAAGSATKSDGAASAG